MHISGVTRNRLLAAAVLSFVFLPSAPRAHAVSKEIVELQTQVQQLLDQVQRLQSTLDTKMGVLQHLAEQTADEANQMTTAVSALQQKLNTQSDAAGGKLDTMSGQVQSLNDSVDELKARIAKLDKSVQDLQTQLQNMQAPPAQAQPGGAGPMPGAPGANGTAPGTPSAQQAPPLQETLQAGVRDYNAGRYDVALGEFQSVVQSYPLDDLAGTAQFYLGEIAYQQKDYATAIKSYNAVLEGFSGNAKAPAAQLHKGYALLAENKKDAGIHELRSLVQRYPQTPEAHAARSKLNGLGVKITAAH
ncbi:MAG TPA: tetratricopeptide repeat protein [Terracidiphilus sp.]|nr:tetratricopeptide repeat protein [Terracidiphilus sp.]